MAAKGAFNSADATVSAKGAVAVTLNDSTVLPTTRAVYVGVTGNLKVTMVNGDEVTFIGIQAGSVLPIQATVLWTTGSTATSVLALY